MTIYIICISVLLSVLFITKMVIHLSDNKLELLQNDSEYGCEHDYKELNTYTITITKRCGQLKETADLLIQQCSKCGKINKIKCVV